LPAGDRFWETRERSWAKARDLGLLEPGESAWLVTNWKARVERI